MDRTRFNAWTRLALPLGALLAAGCDARQPGAIECPAAQSISRPRLLELAVEGHAGLRPIEQATPVGFPSHPTPAGRRAAEAQLVALPALPVTALASTASDVASAGSSTVSACPPKVKLRQPVDSSEIIGDAVAPECPTPAAPELLNAAPVDLPVEAPAALTDEELGGSQPPDLAPAEALPHVAREIDEHEQIPWAKAFARTPETDAVMTRATAMSRHALELAGRGATYSAREQMLDALRLVAQSSDAQQETNIYSKALESGLTALSESRDFYGRSGVLLSERSVADFIRVHQTPIQKTAPEVSPLVAVGRYYTYAREQLAFAAGQHAAGSMTLYGLGKIAAGTGSTAALASTGEAMALYQAAVLVDRRNYRAAHELGVLLARSGRLEESKEMFLHSIAVSPNQASWHNLSVVHAQLGEPQLAQGAQQEAVNADRSGKTEKNIPQVDWVDAQTFSQSGTLPEVPAEKPIAKPPVTATAEPATADKKNLSAWLPWGTSRR